MDFETLGWKGKKVKHEDGREGVVIREDINFDYCICTVQLPEGVTRFTLCANKDDRDAAGWAWWCEKFDGGARWLPFRTPDTPA
jgi:hypothetical protein